MSNIAIHFVLDPMQLSENLKIINIRIPVKDEKPKFNYCWWCSRKLLGRSHRGVTLEDGYERIMHISCTEKFKSKNK